MYLAPNASRHNHAFSAQLSSRRCKAVDSERLTKRSLISRARRHWKSVHEPLCNCVLRRSVCQTLPPVNHTVPIISMSRHRFEGIGRLAMSALGEFVLETPRDHCHQ
ncbi:hypothetical protein EVAR_21648_1 [Eumeta japonica]|uniref:Uncharacterized protein n=1 Tax=Eumeta variegata TaxID=151549 RepID=A0A4C1VJC7_EUMVA|nr:hypothetical protein EVAR_21648_1 [Eumeta japonica]